ncbi:hypothetical protein GCM10009086_31710 [Pseudomonas rhodesiae]
MLTDKAREICLIANDFIAERLCPQRPQTIYEANDFIARLFFDDINNYFGVTGRTDQYDFFHTKLLEIQLPLSFLVDSRSDA